MLAELRVENLLLIERAQLRLAPGLNVLTGETGAGKTVLAHALDLLHGGRARPGIVRPGAAEAYVEGSFEVPEGLPAALRERLAADAEEIVLARRVGADGRTRAYLNGRSATVGELRDLGAELMSFYGQHEHRKLTISAAQLRLLDDLCGPQQALRLRACGEAFAETRLLQARLEELRELAGAREHELDLLEFELAEIDAAELGRREHDELLAARERLRRLDALCSAAGAGADALAPEYSEAPGVAALLAGASACLEPLGGVDPRLDALAERLSALAIESHDLASELRAYCEAPDAGTPTGPESTLEGVEERLAVIERLMRKHGGSVEGVLEHAARSRARREELCGAEVALEETAERLRSAEAALEEHVQAIRAARESAAPRLELGVREQLSALAMPDASFEVTLARREHGPSGGDAVEFLIAPNPGVPAGALREIASGGELSRVMLAITTACGSGANSGRGDGAAARETLVFDEIDAGIGGHAARAVGARLRELGESRQVLCITHLPQIASLADRHFTIAKETCEASTRATVEQLAEREVVSELVRMLGADAGDTAARRHARDLRRAA
ncbi:MAG TPA: DNA repair protein RecN [Solirubrobacteraceae bacterium]|nr:DNA repair protein RecN [Solirubrobacteraceae bacterium]